MAKDDSLPVREFARRYKVSDDDLARLCEANAVHPETVLSREDFKKMLGAHSPDRKDDSGFVATEPAVFKEDQVKETKTAFVRLARDKGLDPPRIAALKVCTGWADDTKITEAELEAAVNKHLKNKEG